MKTTIIAFIALAAASLGDNVAQAHEIPRLRGFADVFEKTSDATCPATCQPVRYGGTTSGCESCPGKPNCIKFNAAGGGAINENHCCNSHALHNAVGGFKSMENIKKHCHVPGTEKEDKAAPNPEPEPEPEPTCPATCQPVRFAGNPSGCESCPGKSNCIKFNAGGGAINGNHCCDSAALHAAEGGFTSKENIEKHCHVPGTEKEDKAAPKPEPAEPEPTCPATCQPARFPGNPSGCESCPGKTNCIIFNNAAGGTIAGNFCCNSAALHDAAGGLTSKENIEKHCSIQL